MPMLERGYQTQEAPELTYSRITSSRAEVNVPNSYNMIFHRKRFRNIVMQQRKKECFAMKITTEEKKLHIEYWGRGQRKAGDSPQSCHQHG